MGLDQGTISGLALGIDGVARCGWEMTRVEITLLASWPAEGRDAGLEGGVCVRCEMGQGLGARKRQCQAQVRGAYGSGSSVGRGQRRRGKGGRKGDERARWAAGGFI